MHPRITIVTPSYNQAEFLDEAITSVLDQRYPNLEYLVLDGGSTDGSADVIARHARHLDHWRSEPDGGQAAALREGFSRATGDILGWVNSDDALAPGALEVVADTWQAAGGGIIVAGGCELIGELGSGATHHPAFQTALDTPQPMPVPEIFDMLRHWFPGEYFYQPEVFFPRLAYEQVGGVDESFYYTMDFDLWARFALLGTPVVVVAQTLALYREHSQQKTDDRGALYREMVATANGYLQRADIDGRARRRLQRSNRAALHPWIRDAYKVWYRARARLGG